MADVKLKDRRTLRQSEYGTAIMGAVSDETNAGETRKFTMAELAEILAAVAPGTPTWERTTLFDGDAIPQSSSGGFSNTVHNLGFKQGSSGPRHDFTDGYQFFVFYITGNISVSATNKRSSISVPVPSILIIESTETAPAGINLGFGTHPSSSDTSTFAISFVRNTDTSFKIAYGIDNGITGKSDLHLWKIEGLKMVIQPSSL